MSDDTIAISIKTWNVIVRKIKHYRLPDMSIEVKQPCRWLVPWGAAGRSSGRVGEAQFLVYVVSYYYVAMDWVRPARVRSDWENICPADTNLEDKSYKITVILKEQLRLQEWFCSKAQIPTTDPTPTHGSLLLCRSDINSRRIIDVLAVS